MKKSSTNIISNKNDNTYRDVRKSIIRCILATDMARHGEIVNQFKRQTNELPYKFNDPESKSLVYIIQIFNKF